MSTRLIPTAVVAFVLGAYAAPAAEQGEGTVRFERQGGDSSRDAALCFETHVRPLLAERCWGCHGSEVQKSGLRLDSLQGLIEGGERGPAIVPGDAKNSLLIHAVNHSEADLQMPQGDKLRAYEIEHLTKWIDEGAIWPGQTARIRATQTPDGPLFTEEEKSFWAFVPPSLPEPPSVQDEAWTKSDLDRFILASLEANGLSPAPPASKRSLIRCAYFDLIGLPPTPRQVDAFLEDDAPSAFERVVDQLLASPRYGERWGRHWLDVARYADSNGLDENWAFEFIYKYRDWVIDAFNKDLPYNEFVTHQLAGDLIPQEPHETEEDYIRRVAATGFLSVGPKMIADDDQEKKKMDIVDEQLSTVSQTFMALSVGCARCHDHKFDPIPTWDYYAMAGIFKSTRTMEHLGVVAPVWLHEFMPPGFDERMAAYDTKLRELTRERDNFWKSIASKTVDVEQAAASAGSPPDESKNDQEFALPKDADLSIPEEHKPRWEALKSAVESHQKTMPEKIKVMAPTEGQPEDLRVHLRGNYLTLGPQTRRQFLRIMDGEELRPIQTQQSGRIELARWLTRPTHPLTARVLVNRVWRWRFARGIVPTTDNFGRLGERPTHPQLLDWLAVKFIEDGWSIKQLHRRMMLSATYQMSTQHNERGYEVDPENRLWRRFPRRRLEAEAIRDAILYVSDNLDLTMHGSLMPLKDRSYVTGTASNTQDYDNRRRSVYQPVYRSAVYDVLAAFDFPDPATPNGDRHDSVVAPQALVMMNSPFVASNARRMAEGLLREWDTDTQRIDALYEKTLGRLPTEQERAAILAHLKQLEWIPQTSQGSAESAARVAAWQSVCRTIISSNEFSYLP